MYAMPFRFGDDWRYESTHFVFEITKEWRNRLRREVNKKVFESGNFNAYIFDKIKETEHYWITGCQEIDVTIEIDPEMSTDQIKVVLYKLAQGDLIKIDVEWAISGKLQDCIEHMGD
jgi:hypothetical protein